MRKQILILVLLALFLFLIILAMMRQPPPPKPKPAAAPAASSQVEEAPKPEPPKAGPVVPKEQASLSPSRNPFRLPEGLAKILREEYRRQQEEIRRRQQQNLQPSAPAPSVSPEELFKVQGVFWGAARPQAIINRKVLSVGDEIKGAKILSISKEGVTLLFEGKEVSLKPPKPELFRGKETQGTGGPPYR